MKLGTFLTLVTAFANLASLIVGFSPYMQEFCITFDHTPMKISFDGSPIEHPQDVAVDPKGNILVLDGAGTNQATLISITSEGRAATLIEQGKMNNPRGLAVQPKLLHVLISDKGQLWELRCGETPGVDQKCPQYASTPYPKLPGKTIDPLGLTADSQGTLFFVDNITHSLKRATIANEMFTVIDTGHLQLPFDVELDPTSSDLYISDSGSGSVFVLECAISDDGFCNKYESVSEGLYRIPEFEGVVKRPTGIAVDFLANLFVADAYHGKIFRLDGRTRLISELLGSDVLASPNGLAINLDTFAVIVADSRSNPSDPAALYRLPCSNIAPPCSANRDSPVTDSCAGTTSGTKCFYTCKDGTTPNGRPWIACLTGSFDTTSASCAPMPARDKVIGPVCTDYTSGTTIVAPVPYNFVNPVDVIVDGGSNIYVIDHQLNSLYSIQGTTGKTQLLINGVLMQGPLAMGLQPNSADLFITVSQSSGKDFHPILQVKCINAVHARHRATCQVYNPYGDARTVGTDPDKGALCTKPGDCALTSITVDGSDNLFIADTLNNRVIRSRGGRGNAGVLLDSDQVPGVQAVQLAGYRAEGGSWDLYIADSTLGVVVLRCQEPTVKSCKRYAPTLENVLPDSTVDISQAALAFDANRNLFVEDNTNARLIKLPWQPSTKNFGAYQLIAKVNRAQTARKPDAVGITVDPNNGAVYIADAALAAVPHSLHRELLRVDCNQIGYSCLGLGDLDVANVKKGTCAGTPLGQSCKVACMEGFRLETPRHTAVCSPDGWLARDMDCVAYSTTEGPEGGIDGQDGGGENSDGGVTTAGIVVLTIAIIVGLAVAGVAIYCFLRIRAISKKGNHLQETILSDQEI